MRDGRKEILPFGNFTYDEGAPEVKADTMYDTASLTKAIVTSTLALMLIDQGKLRLTGKLKDFVPEFRDSDRDLVTIKHLLTYTIDGYVNGRGAISAGLFDMQKFFDTLMTRDFEKRPGTEFKYSNIPATFLGFVVENITGKKLETLAEEWLFMPLGMKRSTFFPERFPHGEIVPTEIDEVRGIVHSHRSR